MRRLPMLFLIAACSNAGSSSNEKVLSRPTAKAIMDAKVAVMPYIESVGVGLQKSECKKASSPEVYDFLRGRGIMNARDSVYQFMGTVTRCYISKDPNFGSLPVDSTSSFRVINLIDKTSVFRSGSHGDVVNLVVARGEWNVSGISQEDGSSVALVTAGPKYAWTDIAKTLSGGAEPPKDGPSFSAPFSFSLRRYDDSGRIEDNQELPWRPERREDGRYVLDVFNRY